MNFHNVHTLYLIFCLNLLIASAIDRHYYIGIVEIEWDYATAKERQLPLLTKKPDDEITVHDHSHMHHHHSKRHAGHEHKHNLTVPQLKTDQSPKSPRQTFIKSVYRPFTDASFSQRLDHPREMGLIGPMILGSPGDRIHVHTKNFARFDFNLHPHLMRFHPDEGPGVASHGGEWHYEWHVRPTDGPQSPDEPCILGAYHSGLNSLGAEMEAGLIGPTLVCRRDVSPDVQNEYVLKSGELLAFAIAKVFNEKDSIYAAINGAAYRTEPTVYPTLNGLTRRSSLNNSISLFQSLTCQTPAVLMPVFTLGGSPDFHLLTTSCGLMFQNGRSMQDTTSLYSAGFRILRLETSEIIRYMHQFHDDRCSLQSADAKLETSLSVNLFPTNFNCQVDEDNPMPSKVQPSVTFTVELEHVLWEYGNISGCSKFEKLRFKSNLPGLLGPTLWTSVGDHFQVYFKRLKGSNYELKMPPMIHLVAKHLETVTNNIVYQFAVKPTQIGTLHDSPCRPFHYTATPDSASSSLTPSSSSFDTGLVGALIICQNPAELSRAHLTDSLVVAPLIIDETKSWLALQNQACLDRQSSPVFHTINGLPGGAASFGTFRPGSTVWWYLLNMPPLPGRQVHFQHSITFGDEGRRNPVYLEQLAGKKEQRSVVPGSTVVIHGTGRAVVMEVGAGDDSPSQGGGDETWAIYCQLSTHLGKGMWATFSTKATSDSPENLSLRISRRYHLFAREIDWDYKGNVSTLPSGHMAHHHHGGPSNPVLESRRNAFKKLVFRSDDLPEHHLGLLGPILELQEGTSIEVTLTNEASKTVSLNPGAGVLVELLDGEWMVSPGSQATFSWQLPKNWQFAKPPNSYFSECTATLYTSDEEQIGDLYAGLVGPLLLCPETVSHPPDRQFFSLYARFDESRSSLAHLNNLNYLERESPSKPLIFDTVNGRLMGNVDWPGFAMLANETIDWFMFAVGDYNDIHTVHYHGSAFGYVDWDTRGTPRIVDSVVVFPGQSITGLAVVGRMQPVPAGTWPIHCHIQEHAQRGMMAQYVVYDKPEPNIVAILSKSTQAQLKDRHFTAFRSVAVMAALPAISERKLYQCLPYCMVLFTLYLGLKIRSGGRMVLVSLCNRNPLRLVICRCFSFLGSQEQRPPSPTIRPSPPIISLQ